MRSCWIMAISPSIRRYGRNIYLANTCALKEVVMPRESGASRPARPLDSVPDVSGILDRPLSRAMTLFAFSSSSRRPGLLRVFPGRLRQRHGALGRFNRLRVRRGAVADPPRDTLRDAGE